MDELTRLAFIFGQQDREAMAEAWPSGSPERAEADALAKEMETYRKRKWGRTKLEAVLAGAKTVNVLKTLHDA